MIPDLRLDDRLRFYEDVIVNLFYEGQDFYERLAFIQQHQPPMTLVALSSELHKVREMSAELEASERHDAHLQVLLSTLHLDGFFDGWDVLLILAYIQHLNTDAICVNRYGTFETPEVIDTMAKKLYEIHEELQRSLSHLGRDIRDSTNSRQSDEDSFYYLTETFNNFLQEHVHDCYDIKLGKQTRTKIIKKMKSLYRSLASLDDEFNNMYDYLGLIRYHGSDHGLCSMVHEQVRNDIENMFSKCTFNQKLSLLDDCVLDSIVEDIEVDSLEGIDKFKSLVLRSEEFDKVVDELKKDFFSGVPEYDPYD